MASSVFRSTIANTLKRTLEGIMDDKTDGIQSKVQFQKYFAKKSTEDAYVDVLEIAGPGLASETAEGTELPLVSIKEGVLARHYVRKFGLKITVSEEAMEDSKYPDAIKAAKRGKLSIWQTADVDGALVLARAENSAYAGVGGQPLASDSHPLAHGGTFSNKMSTPMTPSHTAVTVARAAIRTMPGHNGIRTMIMPKRVLCPIEQESVWEQLTLSSLEPESGNFAAINVVKKMGLEVLPVLQWTNTDSNWAIQTDNDDGLVWYWRRKPRSRTTVDEDHEVMKHLISARWTRGWNDPRGIYWVGS